MMQLPDLNKIAIIHYGCSSFKTNPNVIYWIGIIYYLKGEKTYKLWEGEEYSILKKYSEFLEKYNDKIYIHWSMNSPKFGFNIFKIKAEEAGLSIIVNPTTVLDLSEYLKTKYGEQYINRSGGRLDNLAILNGFTGRKTGVEVKTRNEAADRMELLFSIVQAEKQGSLLVNHKTIYNPYPDLWNAEGYQLFLYLYQNYIIKKQSKADFVRVMHFLRELSRDSSNNYFFKASSSNYIKYVEENYSTKITNIDKPNNYNDEIAELRSLRLQFESK
jgi:hypothetical protein